MDWDKIKREYIVSNISYRKLAAKHNVPFGTLKRIATRDGWVEQRGRYKVNVDTKSLAKAEAKAIDYKSFLYDLAYKVAHQLNDMINESTISELAGYGIKPKDITGAIKDLEDALHIKSAEDLKEQQARIEKLRKEAQAEHENKDINVIIDNGLDDYTN